MNSKNNHGHMIDLLFSLSLLCLFAATAFSVVLIGANVYHETVSSVEENSTARTALAYITQKIRQHDNGQVYLDTHQGVSALALDQEYKDTIYTTFIYLYEGALREQFVRKDTPLSLEAGQEIIELNSLQMQLDSNLLRFTLSTNDTKDLTLYIHTRADGS